MGIAGMRAACWILGFWLLIAPEVISNTVCTPATAISSAEKPQIHLSIIDYFENSKPVQQLHVREKVRLRKCWIALGLDLSQR